MEPTPAPLSVFTLAQRRREAVPPPPPAPVGPLKGDIERFIFSLAAGTVLRDTATRGALTEVYHLRVYGASMHRLRLAYCTESGDLIDPLDGEVISIHLPSAAKRYVSASPEHIAFEQGGILHTFTRASIGG